jgi:glycosyltransferase involved in cell wall biosynthesis
VHLVVPDSFDDPARPSGGNTYDRRVCTGLEALGWSVRVHALPGSWPHPSTANLAALAGVLGALPQDALVLVDGLVASCSADLVVPVATRLRVAVLVHLPLGHAGARGATGRGAVGSRCSPAMVESAVLGSAAAVLTTSRWTRDWLVDHYDLTPERLHVALPGADRAPAATGTRTGAALLCVAAVVPAKGHVELLDALASVDDLSWRLVCAGALDLDPDHAARLRRQCLDLGIADRVTFTGPLADHELEREYAAADLVVLASRIETYGLVVTEALARALPVIALSVGGVPEAMGSTTDGPLPGLLVPATGAELGHALRCWLRDACLRESLEAAARRRRATLAQWSETAQYVSEVLAGIVGVPHGTGAGTLIGKPGARP